MPSILIDTNLLVYLYDPSTPEKQKRAELALDQLHRMGAGCLSAQNLAEFFSIATRKLDPPLTPTQAYEQVSLLAETWQVFDLTPLIVLEAARGARDHGLAYYDAQVWAAARLNQVTTVFSEDFSDGQTLEGVRFVNPFAPGFRVEDWV
jgi:predicted nucleic acid-binding protein